MSKYRDAREGFHEGATSERPEVVTDEHLAYLDELRESGETNMFGARPYLMREFPNLTPKEAATVLSFWMHSK